MLWEPKSEAMICISTKLMSKEASFPLHSVWLQERFREDAFPMGRKPIGCEVRITYSRLYESFLFQYNFCLRAGGRGGGGRSKSALWKIPLSYIKLFCILFTLSERNSLFSHYGIVLYNIDLHRRWSSQKGTGNQKYSKENPSHLRRLCLAYLKFQPNCWYGNKNIHSSKVELVVWGMPQKYILKPLLFD